MVFHLCHVTIKTNTLLLPTVCPALLSGADSSLLLVPVVYFAKCQAKRTEVSLRHCTPPLRCKLAKIRSDKKTENLGCSSGISMTVNTFFNVSMRSIVIMIIIYAIAVFSNGKTGRTEPML